MGNVGGPGGNLAVLMLLLYSHLERKTKVTRVTTPAMEKGRSTASQVSAMMKCPLRGESGSVVLAEMD